MKKQALLAKIDTLPEETVDKLKLFCQSPFISNEWKWHQTSSKHRTVNTRHADTTPNQGMTKHKNDANHKLPVIDVAEALKGYKSPFPEVNDHTVLDKPTPGIAKGKFWMADDFDESKHHLRG